MERACGNFADGIVGWVSPVALCFLLVLLIAGGPEARAQDSPHGKLSFACEECHSPDSWKEMPNPAKFDHAQTGFILRGQHAEVACMDCHTALTFKFKKSAERCADCHQDVHNAELGATCDRCHTVKSWLVPDMVQKHSTTRFALVGMHATVPCEECHVNEQKHEYVGLRTDCLGCHQRDYDGTTAPNHRASGLGTDCQSCHAVNAMSWQGVNFAGGGTFDHAKTGFPLVGAHAALACNQCHPSTTNWVTTATTCYGCHQQDMLTKANAPTPHAGFPTDCSMCHTTNAGWAPSTFVHSTVFVIAGAHAALACNQCHTSTTNWATTATTCYGCHQTDFTTANAPPHTGFVTDCSTCHTNTAWSPATFDHTKNTTFPLTGAHTTVTPCAACHVNNVYAGLPTLCYSCHQQDMLTKATTPVPHTGFPTDCSTCHTTNPGWTPSTYTHANATPRFPQDSRHLNAGCAKCQ